MKKKSQMIIMVGLPACGKNTWIEKNKKDYIVVELDYIRRVILGHQFHQNAEFLVIGMAKSIVRMLCSQGKNVIINSTGLTAFIRNDWVKLAQEYNYQTTIVFLDTPVETCYSRNNKRVDNKVPEEVMDRMALMLQIPFLGDVMDKSYDLMGVDKADKLIVIK